MADIRIIPQTVTKVGAAPTFQGSLTTSDVYLVQNNGATWIEVKKSGAGSCTVTVQTPRTVDGIAVAEHTFNVPATTGDMVVGPFPPDTFNDPVGDLRMTFSEITGLTAAAFRM